MKDFSPIKIGMLIYKSTIIFVFLLVSYHVAYAGTLSCSVTTKAACTGTVIYRMSGSSDAHAQLPSESNTHYDNNVVCCTGVTGLGNSCSGTYAIALQLNKTTNAHAQINTQTGYTNNACISVPTSGTVSVGYVTDPNTCTGAGYDTTLGSIYANTNSHVGDVSAYSIKICASASATTKVSATGVMTSSVFDTTSATASVGYNSIMWKGTVGTGKVGFQLAASDSPSGPWSYYGGDTCQANDWFYTTPNLPVKLVGNSLNNLVCHDAWKNKRYYRYKVRICSASNCTDQGDVSPVVNKIIVNWSN